MSSKRRRKNKVLAQPAPGGDSPIISRLKELIPQKLDDTWTPELAGCNQILLPNGATTITYPADKETLVQAWHLAAIEAAEQEILQELGQPPGTPLQIPADPSLIIKRDVINLGDLRDPETGAFPIREHTCPSPACMKVHLQLMQNNFDTPNVYGPMLEVYRAEFNPAYAPEDYYANALLALTKGTTYFIEPTMSHSISKAAHQISESKPITADLFPSPAGLCWLAEPNKQLTPGETIRAISWTLTRTAYSDAGNRFMLLPTLPEELPESNATAVWVHLWLDSNDYESVFGVFPLPRAFLWHVFTAAGLRDAGSQAAAELSWLAAFLRGYEEGEHGVL